jgi:glycogen(starch) synthase
VRDDSGNVDGLPNVVMEALASGTPLVTTTAGGIGSVVDDGTTALVVGERDAAAIARALRALFDDPARGGTIGAAARDLVQRQFGWDRAAERFEAAYSRALAFKSLRD